MDNHILEVVEYEGVCCENTLTLDHFCGNGTLLKGKLRSRCNKCHKEVPAAQFQSFDNPPRVYMVKFCPEHGETSSRLSSDAAYFFKADNGQACACGPGGCKPTALGENAKTQSMMHTCSLVIEIVEDCNLTCPTCYADSPYRSKGSHGSYLSLEDFKTRITGVLAGQDKIDILQLSGGEPTLHPQLFELIEWSIAQEGIARILLNTNGLKLANEKFVRDLAAVAPMHRFAVYLQYDGNEEPGQFALRGGDFRPARKRALAHCAKYEVPVALVMTVTHDNKFACASALNAALADDNVSWIIFQPEFISGRNDPAKILEIPINVADVVHSVARGSIMDKGSWMPLPCSHPNCGTIGFVVRLGGVWQPVSKIVDMSQYAPLIENRMSINYTDSLSNCGCDEYDLEEKMQKFGVKREDLKMVFIKPFMDTRTWDEARIAACCTHVVTPDGKLDSFCRYYANKALETA
jgi:uncharacterized radical SAM superfamily Fe-S cluster-containing enzyme